MRQVDAIDKIILFLCCGFLGSFANYESLPVVPYIIAAIALGAISYIDSLKYRTLVVTIYSFLCFFYPPLCFFIPAIIYGLFVNYKQYSFLIGIIPIIFAPELVLNNRLLILVITLLSIMLKNKEVKITNSKRDYLKLLDSTKEMSHDLEKQNRYLTEKQDDEIRVATLNERNRIAREIHDHVGHQLTRAILQIGALMVSTHTSTKPSQDDAHPSLTHPSDTYPSDKYPSDKYTVVKSTTEEVSPELLLIKNTLDSAMDSIRNSVHNLHESSIDLNLQLETLISSFTFCKIEMNMNFVTPPDHKTSYAIIAIVKESLSNIIKHSNATLATLSFTEHPGFFQIIISDNGKIIKEDINNGIGLKNIEQRIDALDGHFLIRTKGGFELFITIPKEKKAASPHLSHK